jgi:hypothetical protein
MMGTFKLWYYLSRIEQDRVLHKFPTIHPPDHRLDEVEKRPEIVHIMKEPPVGEQAIIGKTPVTIKRRKTKKEVK